MKTIMKTTIIFKIALVATSIFVINSCSKVENPDSPKGTVKMTLSATLPQQDSTNKATFDMSGSTWQFSFTKKDVVSATNTEVSGTFYSFTKPESGNFTSEDAQTTTETATWYAYFPKVSGGVISLTNQIGTADGVANLYAMAAKQENVPAGTQSLSFEMSPKVSVLKITNPLATAVDVYVKNADGNYITGLTANADGFTVNSQETAVSAATISASGTGYVVVPAGIKITLDFSSGYVKSTKSTGFVEGKYYPVTISTTIVTLPGEFTVGSDGHKVKFAKGNLYWDGSSYQIEENQYDIRTSYDANHVTHFHKYYHGAKGKPYDQNYSTNYIYATHQTTAQATIELDYVIDGYRVIAYEEFNYLITSNKAINYQNKTIDGLEYKCLLIYPDNYSGEYDETTWDAINKAGIIFLQANGRRSGKTIYSAGTYGYIMVGVTLNSALWSVPSCYNYGQEAAFNTYSEGVTVRLVKDVKY